MYTAIIRNQQGVRVITVGTYKTLLGAKKSASKDLACYGRGYRAEITVEGADWHASEKPFGGSWYTV